MGKFILRAAGGQYSFTFHAQSGELVATSPPFITRSSAQQALNEARVSCHSSYLYKSLEADGQYYFELYSTQEKLLLTGERHWSEDSRDYSIVLLRRDGERAKYVEAI